LQCTCTILGDSDTGEGIVFDPGGNPEMIMEAVTALGLTIKALVHTHAHLDHILAAGEIKKRTGAPIFLNQADRFLWDALEQQCQIFRVPYVAQPAPDHELTDDQALDCCRGVSIFSPGHTPGSMCFYFEADRLLIAGDTLFRGSIGRTDLWGGSSTQIERSIRERLYALDEQAVVVTGHGPETTIGWEMRRNGFVRA
jgi:glyoxylase-like metal-dependent hydrolase (beta-lactamase superfamily II)